MQKKKIKIVIDTNIMISSLWGGKPYDIIQLWSKGHIMMVASPEIIDEYIEVFKRFDLSEEDLEVLTLLFTNPDNTILVTPKTKTFTIKNDPDDSKFLECAFYGKADYIVSGDKHLLTITDFKHSKITTHADFLEIYRHR
jgi:putative PIN family toxin of toxin-antitoxin system